MTAEIIKFPKTPEEKISSKAKEALEMEMRKNRIETNLNVLLGNDSWDLYTFSAEELECLALFGDVMRFDPKIASRLISKLAEFIARLSKTMTALEDEGPYG